jgi:two-component system sensor kinase FixL
MIASNWQWNNMEIEEQILKTVYDTSLDAIIVIDEQGIIHSFNRSAERMFGYSPEEVLGQNVKMLMPPYFAERHDGFLARYRETGEKRIIGIGRIATGQRKDGSTFALELSIGEAKVGKRRVFTGFVRDLTEYQQTEQRVHELQDELLHASRLASLGEISTMVAHEANQPLSAAATYLEVARELLGKGKREDRARAAKALDQVEVQIRRVAETVRRIREFAKKSAPELELADVNRVIEEANGIASVGMKGKGIRTFFDLSPALPSIEMDKIQIQQVVMNLVRNGIEAMKDRTRRDIVLRSRLDSNGMVEISVIDSGTGVPAETAKNLFKAFVTTKKDGTGLGLAICRSIVEAHGGRLWHEPNPQGGAAFKFTLPIKSARHNIVAANA